MTTKERQDVRAKLAEAGFQKQWNDEEPHQFDPGTGVYTEVWRHRLDRTKVTLEWDRKTES